VKPRVARVLVFPTPVGSQASAGHLLTKRTSIMARIALGLLSLALLLGVSGCTWTETYRDYPPRLKSMDDHMIRHGSDVLHE
jgi:hypothetical protein